MKSFAEAHPELVPEWDSLKNDCGPDEISFGSHRKVFWIGKCGHRWDAVVKNRSNGHGCPVCSGNRTLPGVNDLETFYPDLTKEWSERNSPLKPSEVTVRANRKVWWQCGQCGHLWQSRISDRTEGHGCPVCSGGKLIAGLNDLASCYPELAEEWGEDNSDLTPEMVWPRSRLKVWWKCRKCGYQWKAVINSRVNGLGCPVCTGKVILPGYNDLKTLYPKLAGEWCIARNGFVEACTVSPGSHNHAFWQCVRGHIWNCKIIDRVNGAECPVCKRKREEEQMLQAVRDYAKTAGLRLIEKDDSVIGIPIRFWFPEQRFGIEFYESDDKKGPLRRWENAKNWLCLNAGIRLVRILSPGAAAFENCYCVRIREHTEAALEEAIRRAFQEGEASMDEDLENNPL